jgi:hypothetical protein
MKCSNPQCNHGFGLVSYRRGAFTKGRYCSKKCRDSYVAERAMPAVPGRAATTYFEWLFQQTYCAPNRRAELPFSVTAAPPLQR